MPAATGLVFEIAGRLVSIAVLGFSILRGGSPLLFLWGLWIEEVLSFAGLSIRQAILRRHRISGPYIAFPAAHLVFVLFFSVAGVTGMFSAPSVPRLALPPVRSVLAMAGVLAFWTAVDIVRSVRHRRASKEDAGEEGRIDREAWLVLFLPHVTIIAGGFCLVMLRLGNWMAWGLLAGKVLFEAVSFAVVHGTAREPETGSADEPRDGERPRSSASGRGS